MLRTGGEPLTLTLTLALAQTLTLTLTLVLPPTLTPTLTLALTLTLPGGRRGARLRPPARERRQRAAHAPRRLGHLLTRWREGNPADHCGRAVPLFLFCVEQWRPPPRGAGRGIEHARVGVRGGRGRGRCRRLSCVDHVPGIRLGPGLAVRALAFRQRAKTVAPLLLFVVDDGCCWMLRARCAPGGPSCYALIINKLTPFLCREMAISLKRPYRL